MPEKSIYFGTICQRVRPDDISLALTKANKKVLKPFPFALVGH